MPGSRSPRLQPQELDLEGSTYTLVYENDDGEAQRVLALVSPSAKPFY